MFIKRKYKANNTVKIFKKKKKSKANSRWGAGNVCSGCSVKLLQPVSMHLSQRHPPAESRVSAGTRAHEKKCVNRKIEKKTILPAEGDKMTIGRRGCVHESKSRKCYHLEPAMITHSTDLHCPTHTHSIWGRWNKTVLIPFTHDSTRHIWVRRMWKKRKSTIYIYVNTRLGWGEERADRLYKRNRRRTEAHRKKKRGKTRGKLASTPGAKLLFAVCRRFFFQIFSQPFIWEMEAVKFVALLLLVVAVQVFGALGFSSDEEDGEVWMVQNWKVKLKCNISFFCYTFTLFFFSNWDKCEWRRDFTHDFYARFYARSGARCAVTSQRFLAIYD